ncbi:MAG: hypothetical protein A4E66_01922 [Syntrophus sp. PtaB.Bin001]|nr:MAG: hypothetical protein A4E66_01922 [Syntrophus sp. PtaB.Bin001]
MIPGALHELRRNDAGRAITRGKGFVQVGHHAADGRGTLHEVDFKTGIGQIERGLNAGDSAAFNEDRPNLFVFTFFHNF